MSNEIMTTANQTNDAYRNTLDLATIDGKKSTLNALNSAVSLNDYNDTPLNVVDVITTPGMRKSRVAGVEDTPCQNTYLIDSDGRAYFTQSDGIARSINGILAFFTPDEIHAGIAMCVRASQLPNGNTIKSLELL